MALAARVAAVLEPIQYSRRCGWSAAKQIALGDEFGLKDRWDGLGAARQSR